MSTDTAPAFLADDRSPMSNLSARRHALAAEAAARSSASHSRDDFAAAQLAAAVAELSRAVFDLATSMNADATTAQGSEPASTR
jgi:hypothetical protein